MAKPTELGEWATNPGQALEPSTGQKAAGFIEGDKPPARWINWLWNVSHQWHKYLDNLHGESEFLNKAYPWAGKHTWSGTLAGNTEPEFSDLTVHSNLVAEGDVKLVGTGNEVLYADADGAPTPRVRKVMVPLSSGNGHAVGANPATYSHTNGYWYWPTTAGPMSLPLRLPQGARLEVVTIGAENTAGAPRTFVAQVFRRTADKTTPGASATTEIADDGGSGGAPGNFLAFVSPNETIDNTTNDYWLCITGGDGIRMHWVELMYRDPGPRNF